MNHKEIIRFRVKESSETINLNFISICVVFKAITWNEFIQVASTKSGEIRAEDLILKCFNIEKAIIREIIEINGINTTQQ